MSRLGGYSGKQPTWSVTSRPGKWSIQSAFQYALTREWPGRRRFTVSPAVSGLTTWDLYSNGPLILDGGTATSYTLTATTSFRFSVKMWGQGGKGAAGGLGGYSVGDIITTPNQVFSVRLNTGGGTGQNAGGGYAGIFYGPSVSQATAIIIAGGGGGASNTPSPGGVGGGTTGTDGTSTPTTTGGGGASQVAGGAGGSASPAYSGSPGGTGTTLLGGNGSPSNGPTGAGGGGGGGYFGGGGGRGSGTQQLSPTFFNYASASGGGGGSGYISPVYSINGATGTYANASDPLRGPGGSVNGNARIVIY